MLFNSFKIAFSMYSKIPMPHTQWNEKNMRYSMCFFPLIGVVIGMLLIIWQKISDYFGVNLLFKSTIMVILPILITGGIHLDGFMDTSDAINSYKSTDEKLEILKDSHVGAFAVISVCIYLLAYLGASSQITGKMAYIMAASYVLCRALSALAVVTFKCAKSSGLLYAFSDSAQKNTVKITMIIYIIICAAIMLDIDIFVGTVCLITAIATFFYYKKMSYKKFGGITGDLAGWFLQMCELNILIAIAILQMGL